MEQTIPSRLAGVGLAFMFPAERHRRILNDCACRIACSQYWPIRSAGRRVLYRAAGILGHRQVTKLRTRIARNWQRRRAEANHGVRVGKGKLDLAAKRKRQIDGLERFEAGREDFERVFPA